MTGVGEYALDILITTLIYIILLFGPLVLVGFGIAFLEKWSNRILMKVFSFKAVIFSTGWIGTPIHELGHAFFCLVFLHKIHKVVLFNPKPQDDGSYVLGYVEHSPKVKFWSQVGYLFIGTGPIWFGSAVILLLLTFLHPGGKDIFPALFDLAKESNLAERDFSAFGKMLLGTLKLTLITIFANGKIIGEPGNRVVPILRFIGFLIFSCSIALHMHLSPPDLKSAWKGGLLISGLILISSIILVAFDLKFIDKISTGIMLYTGVLFMGLILAAVAFVLIYIIMLPLMKLKGK